MSDIIPADRLLPLPIPFLPAGAIFDCDGTVVDTMPTHFVAWRKTLDDLGHTAIFPEDQFYAWGGVPPREIIERLNAEHHLSMPAQEIADLKENNYSALIYNVKPIEFVVREARRLKDAGVPLAVASGGRRDVVTKSLEVSGIRDLFRFVLGSEDAVNGKPAPDIFLNAAAKLGVAPADCVVYEDAPAGLLAAYRAGMKAVDITKYR